MPWCFTATELSLLTPMLHPNKLSNTSFINVLIFCVYFLSLSSILVAHASLFIQNISVTICSIVLMLVFLYKQRIEQIWDGWLTVSTCSLFDHSLQLHNCITVPMYNKNNPQCVSHRQVIITALVPFVLCPCCLCV